MAPTSLRWSREGGQKKDVYFFCYGNEINGTSSDKGRKYDEAFKAEALRLAGESRSTQAAARQLGISPKLLYRWQQAQLVAEVGSEGYASTYRVITISKQADKLVFEDIDE
jgi:transposase